ncbi:trypsin eta-like [Danaus plexippus]|uniref:trypsin eta-like n=1 Tax=Danaus plexippus TaxID=13037 RepID=UPI002AB0E813|nr:trypsin eta-like [Danaus plexippus]
MHASNSYIIHLNNYCVRDAEGTPRSRVLDIVRHPLYNESSKEHDIALLRLQLYLDDITWLNVLPYSSFGISGGCVFYGYGYYDEKEVPSQTLRAAALELMSLDKCTELLGKYVAPEPNSGMLCASGNGADACLGDSGGPLICAGKLQGLSSYGLTCSKHGLPGVYTSIGAHLHWILGFLGK